MDNPYKLCLLYTSKDPHTGAFAIIVCAVYVLCYAGGMVQWAGLVMGKITSAQALSDSAALGAVFVMERALSGLSVASFPCAKGTGLAAAFADSAQKKTVRFWLVIWLAVCFCVLIGNAGWAGIGTGIGAGLVLSLIHISSEVLLSERNLAEAVFRWRRRSRADYQTRPFLSGRKGGH